MRGGDTRPTFQHDSGWNEVHVGDTVLKTDGDKSHNGEEYREYLADGLAGGQCHPDGQTYQPVASDAAKKRLAKAHCNFTISNCYSSIVNSIRSQGINFNINGAAVCNRACAGDVTCDKNTRSNTISKVAKSGSSIGIDLSTDIAGVS